MPAYWDTATNYFNEVSFCILCYFGGTPKVNDHFIKNIEKYRELYGTDDVKFVAGNIVTYKFKEAVKAKDRKLFEEAKTFCNTHHTAEDSKIVTDHFEMEFLQATGNWTEIANTIAAKKEALIQSNEMNAYCWTIFEKCDDKAILNKAVVWMKELTDKNPAAGSLDTYANLLFKTGDKTNAITLMQQAVAMGKKNGEDVSQSEEALKKFQQ